MKTDLNYIKKLIKLLESGDVNEIEIDEEGTRIKLVKAKQNDNQAPQIISYAPPQYQQMPQVQQSPASEQSAPKAEEKKDVKEAPKENLIEVKSPIVGTFYRAPSPTADPYVQVGHSIAKGSVLCIIEAMKLMNEIESEVSGKIVKILVENAQPVEYNQTLFLVDPKG
jgi:acetyl-CoA carboxylase biotin carboxyl carrier protein